MNMSTLEQSTMALSYAKLMTCSSNKFRAEIQQVRLGGCSPAPCFPITCYFCSYYSGEADLATFVSISQPQVMTQYSVMKHSWILTP